MTQNRPINDTHIRSHEKGNKNELQLPHQKLLTTRRIVAKVKIIFTSKQSHKSLNREYYF